MPLPESIRAKLDQAKLHLDALNVETARYISGNPGEVVPNPDGDPNHPTFIYRQKDPVPSRISLLAGDSLQNLRSALDYLIWELVLVAGNVPTRKNVFPICPNAPDFNDAKRRDLLTGIAGGSETLIQRLQPYTHTQPSEHWLAILNDLTNINKHRRLFMAALSGFSMSGFMAELDTAITWGDPNVPGVIHNTKTGNILTAEQVQMQGDFVAFVAFNEGAVKGMEVGMAVETFIGVVTDTLRLFKQFFP